jgi:DNA-binding GntR family transcriptional regulator
MERRKESLAQRITRGLRAAIVGGEIAPGTVLTEEPLARLLGVSRDPVRAAMQALLAEGLVHRAGPRGTVVGPEGVTALRTPLAESLAGLTLLQEPKVSFAWQTLYDEVEARVVHRAFFGRARINEHELARHYGVGRTVARDVLSRLETLGMTEKDASSRWSVVPLDERRIRELYELRAQLEPVAIAGALDHLDPVEVAAMAARHRDGLARYPDITAAEMYALEVDLHVTCVQASPNRELIQALQRSHCVLTLSKHTVGTRVAKPPREGFFEEHLAVFDAMARGDREGVADAVRQHILASENKVVQRADLVRREGRPEPASFFG